MSLKYSLTKEQILKEIVRCGRDPVYFMKNYVKIVHPTKGLIPFILFPFQEDTLRKFDENRFNIILKSRQMGLSTLSSAYIAWFMLFQRNRNILAMATKLGVAQNLVKKVKTILKNLPDWMIANTSDIRINNTQSIELHNGSVFKASTKSPDAGRSEALSLLVLDEAAHIAGMAEIWKSIAPTITLGGRCIALSSPNGVGNWFYETYKDAEEGRNDFCPIRLHWSLHPERDDAWFEKETRNMSARDVAQEFSCSFLASGLTLIESDDILRIEKTDICEPLYRTGFDRNLWIWEEYEPKNSYILSADVARGDGEDFSAFHVLKLEPFEVVADYKGKITPDLFAEFLMQVGRDYGNCLLIVENNNLGWMVLTRLREMRYSNLFWSFKTALQPRFVDPYTAENSDKNALGFNTNHNNRVHILGKFEEYVRNLTVTFHSARTLNEIRTFIYKPDGRAEAAKGYNDDLVMSLAIACWLKETALTINAREVETTKAMLSVFSTTSRGINTKIPGQLGFGSGKSSTERMKIEKERRGQIDLSKEEAIPAGRAVGYPPVIFIG